MASTAYALECKSYFLGAQRTEVYALYKEGAAQPKNSFCLKTTLQDQTCFGLEGWGA